MDGTKDVDGRGEDEAVADDDDSKWISVCNNKSTNVLQSNMVSFWIIHKQVVDVVRLSSGFSSGMTTDEISIV